MYSSFAKPEWWPWDAWSANAVNNAQVPTMKTLARELMHKEIKRLVGCFVEAHQSSAQPDQQELSQCSML